MGEAFVLSVDLGGTKTNISKVINGTISELRRFPTDQSCHALLLGQLSDAIALYLAENCRDERPSSIGMGIKGYVDSRNGEWKRCISIPDFAPVALAQMINNRFGIPTYIDNDVHAATLAELYYGAGKRYSNFIYYNIGTGISMGMVCDGRLIRGSTNYSGEIGHMVTESEGEPCPCGHFGCLEEIASGAAIIAQAQKGIENFPDSLLSGCTSGLTSHTVFMMADKGDELAQKIADRVKKSICLSMVAILNIFNPEAVVFGGGVMTDGWLLPDIREYSYKYPLRPAAWALKEVALSELGADTVGALGAAAVVLDHTKK